MSEYTGFIAGDHFFATGGIVTYTVNGVAPDEDGNFSITAASIGAAELVHTHSIADIAELQTTLNGKSPTSHTHDLVTTLLVNGSSLTGTITLQGTSHAVITNAGQVVTITALPYTGDIASELTDMNTSNTEAIQMFTGTQAEWDAFTKTAGVKYIVFIHE